MRSLTTAMHQSLPARTTRWAHRAAPGLLVLGLVACGTDSQTSDSAAQDADAESAAQASPPTAEVESPDEPETFTIAGAGDVITHDHILDAAVSLADDSEEDHV